MVKQRESVDKENLRQTSKLWSGKPRNRMEIKSINTKTYGPEHREQCKDRKGVLGQETCSMDVVRNRIRGWDSHDGQERQCLALKKQWRRHWTETQRSIPRHSNRAGARRILLRLAALCKAECGFDHCRLKHQPRYHARIGIQTDRRIRTLLPPASAMTNLCAESSTNLHISRAFRIFSLPQWRTVVIPLLLTCISTRSMRSERI